MIDAVTAQRTGTMPARNSLRLKLQVTGEIRLDIAAYPVSEAVDRALEMFAPAAKENLLTASLMPL